MLYFINIIANIADPVAPLKFITPFGYTEAADIVSSSALDGPKLLVGLAISILSIASAFWKYQRKDLK